MSREWFYLKKEKRHGPVSWEKIIRLYQENKLTKNTKVWSNSYSNWKKLNEVIKNRESKKRKVPPPLPSKKQDPPPIPQAGQSPPPLPPKEEKDIKVGPIQSKEDLIASKLLTKVSFVVLSLLLMGSLYALISGIYQSKGDLSKVTSEKWPSSFGFDNNSSFNPKPPSLSQALVKDIYHTEGFKIGQDKSIDVLSNIYPELSEKLFLTQTKFDSEFGAAFDNIDQTLSSKLSDWDRRKEDIRNSVSDKLSYSNISKSEARQFLQKVEDRVKGKLPSPVLETLLMFHPKYIRNPRLMFSDGYTKEFRSLNSAKVKGVDLVIEYPSSWEAEEGRRPNVIQKFTSENGYGLEIVTIVIKDFPKEIAGEFSEEDILMLSGENIWDDMYGNMTTIDEGNATVASKPTIWGEFAGSINRTGIKLDMHGLGFAMVDEKAMIQILFMVSEPPKESNSDIQIKFEHSAQIFQMMLNSLDFYDKYN